ncbi:MAG TPA: DinB family protein [Bacillota bacterium]|nr:DinB family protein [Bacillota bacterium]
MSLIHQFREGYDLLCHAIEGLTSIEMKQVIEEGKWTIYENVIHVVDADLAYTERIKRVIAEDEPVFLPFDQDLWTKRLNYHECNIEDYLTLFRLSRETISSLLEGMAPELWTRSGKKGEEVITLKQLVEALIGHVENHVRTIERLRNRMNLH